MLLHKVPSHAVRLMCDVSRETRITGPTFSETIISHQYTGCIRNTLQSLKWRNVIWQSGKIVLILLNIYIPCLCEFKFIITFRVCRSVHLHTFKWFNQLDAAINYRFVVGRLDTTQHVSGILKPATCWAVSRRQTINL